MEGVMGGGDSCLEARLLQNGCVVLYHDERIFERDRDCLVATGWRYSEIYRGKDGTPEEFFDQVSGALEFPSYFGRNLNALNDCLSDIGFPDTGRVVLGMKCFDRLATSDQSFAHAVLDVIALHERRFLLEGKCVLVLVQSDDPTLAISSIGGFSVFWNPEEWLNAKRTIS